ncbi:MAG TPA: methyltransferase [Fulvivirga sp.]|nr:methyltransferase [Fulvivirga sp.]
MEDTLKAVDAKYEAQKLAFGPLFFQCVVALRDLGILEYIHKNRNGVTVEDITGELKLTDYGVRVLLEAAKIADVVEYIDQDRIKLTKIGFYILKDDLTKVNINFVQDVCYDGAKYLTESIKNNKPEGLKVFGEWDTVYEGLSQLPEQVRKSWFEFDHFYSDDAFPFALDILFKAKPKYLFDIGGNTGKWSLACCKYDPDVKIKILDLPGQLNVARKNVEAHNLTDRIDFHQINLLDKFQKIPKGADVVWMSQFLDCFSNEEVVQILKNVHQAVDENTSIFIMEPFFDNQNYPAAEYCITATSLYFTVIANGNSKMFSLEVMRRLIDEAGLYIEEESALIGHSFHTILKCRKR